MRLIALYGHEMEKAFVRCSIKTIKTISKVSKCLISTCPFSWITDLHHNYHITNTIYSCVASEYENVWSKNWEKPYFVVICNWIVTIWAATWQNQQSGCAPSENSDQPGHPPSLIRVFAVRMKKAWVLGYPLSAQRRLIRLGGCPGWSESSLGAHSLCWFCHVTAHIFVWGCLKPRINPMP